MWFQVQSNIHFVQFSSVKKKQAVGIKKSFITDGDKTQGDRKANWDHAARYLKEFQHDRHVALKYSWFMCVSEAKYVNLSKNNAPSFICNNKDQSVVAN